MKRLYMIILSVLGSIGIAIAISYAWFLNDTNVNPVAQGRSGAAYFAYGNGTTEPYGITTKRHLYNLAWLTYLFPEDYADKKYELAADIDCDGMVLPPIGKDNAPFTGYFDGNGYTITDLTTSNSLAHMTTKPNSISDDEKETSNTNLLKYAKNIGFFGSIDANGSNNAKVHDFYLDSTTVKTATSQTCVGVVAGYVNGKIEDVGVIAPHLNIQTGSAAANTAKTSNLSDYAVVGYAEEAYTTQKTKTSTIIYNPTYNYSHFNFKGMGNQSDWGGSMNMDDLYHRYRNAMTSNYAMTNGNGYSFNYIDKELIKTDGSVIQNTANSDNEKYGNYYYPKRYYNAQAPENGEYYASLRSDYNTIGNAINNEYSERFNYISGLYKDVYTITRNGSAKTGYKIHDGNYHYLSYDEDTDGFKTVNSENDATIWLFENNKIYTYDEEEYSTTIVRYLNGTTDLTNTLTSTSSTSWSWDSTYNTFKYTYNTVTYYLACVSGTFKMIQGCYVITDGQGNYMKRSGTSIINATDTDDATKWIFSGDNSNLGTITDITDSTKRLNISGTSLVVNDGSTTWGFDGNYISNGENYIDFDGTNWKIANTYKFYYNGHYLMYDNDLSDTTNQSNATKWELSNNLIQHGGTGTISCNGVYLRYENGLTTTNNSSLATVWAHDAGGFYFTSNNSKNYIQYTGGVWVCNSSQTNLTQTIGYYLYTVYNSKNYYISVNNGEVLLDASQNYPTYWFFTNTSNVNKPSGNMYTIIDGFRYYIHVSSGEGINCSLSTSEPHNFSWDNNTLYDQDEGKYFYWNHGIWYGNTSGDDITVSRQSVSVADYGEIYFDYEISLIRESVSSMVSVDLEKLSEEAYELISTKSEKTSEFNYIPLNANKTTFAVENNNTGYIIGGGHENSGQKSDIRVSQYYIYQINQNNSYLNSDGSTTNQKFISFKDNVIRTVDSSGIHNINDSSNSFVKYKASKQQLTNTLSNNGKNNNTYLYGLHFMDASISKDRLITAPKVLINGKTYTNYQMPEDCIDFRVASKGYINFFAGTYFSNNNSFFSLHEIIRDLDENSPTYNEILAIKHISMIYKANSNYGDDYKSADYVYKYDDNSWSGGVDISSTGKYDLVFNSDWIEKPGTASNIGYSNGYGRVFYFEIPVNKGEFALGSVSGRTGAYLFYLDIGANAAPVDRTIITQRTDTTKDVLKYVNGIQILATGASFASDSNTAVAYITTSNANAANNNDISITRSGNTITITNATLKSWYYDEGITLSGGTINPVSSVTSTSNVLKYLDFNRSEDKLYQTTIYNNGTTNTGYDCYRLNKSTMEKINLEEDEWGLLKIVDGSGTPSNSVTDSAFNFSTSTTTKILDYYSYILTSNVSQLTDTNDMVIADNSSNYLPPADGEYTYEHSYKMTGNAITMTPDDLLVYFGPTLKNSVTVSGPTSNVATVTITVGGTPYTFTFNADAIDNTNKTVTVYVSA